MMRWFVFLILLLIVPFAYSAAWQSVVQVSCSDNMCIEGTPMNYSVTVANVGETNFTLKSIEIRDSEGITLSLIPIMNVFLESGTYKTFLMQSVTPPAVRGSTLIYDVCYTLEEQGRTSQSCDLNKRFMTIIPKSEVDCIQDDDCARGYECAGYKCYEKTKTKSEIYGTYLGYFALIVIIALAIYFIWWLKTH